MRIKLFATLCTILFGYSAFIQLNDPDPIRWFALYATASVLSAISLLGTVRGSAFAVLACGSGLWAISLMPSVVSDGIYTGTEEERELGGLILVSLASYVMWRSGTRD